MRHAAAPLLLLLPTAAAAAAGYEVVAASGGVNASRPAAINATTVGGAGGSGHDGFVAVIDGAAAWFRAAGQCAGVKKTTATAAAAGCRYATNGGPFNSYTEGGCIGILVQGGTAVNTDWNTSYPSFGVTRDGQWVIGHVGEADAARLGVAEALTGFDWLVRGGAAVPAAGGETAGRTAVGADRHGRLLVAQVDGCEHCLSPSGLTLRGAAEFLVGLGALHAINMDGGSSCATAVDGRLVDRPTCLGVGVPICERAVTTVVCVK